jgi:hypothetical protein
MSRVSEASAALDRVVLASRQQVLLRSLLLAAALAFLLLVPAAGGTPGRFAILALVVAAAVAALAPAGNAPLVLVLGLGWLWWGQVPDAWTTWSLGAGVLLLVVHVASTLCGHGPPALVLPGSLLRAWVGRSMVLAAATALVWLAAGLLTTLDLPQSPVAVVVAMALVAGWIVLLLSRLVTADA